MAETLAYNFVGNDELSKLFEVLDRVAGKLDKTLDGLGDQAAQMGRRMTVAEKEAKQLGDQVKDTGEDADKASRKVNDFGDQMGKAAVKAALFEAELRRARRSVRELTDEYQRTGDVDLLSKIGDERGNLAKLERLAKEMGKFGQDAGKEGGKGFSAALQGALSTPVLGPLLATTLVGAVVVAAPAVGAAMAAAVTVGVGSGALAAGIVLAAKDKRVTDAWKDFGDAAKDELTGAASVFVQPLVSSTRTFKSAFDEIMPSVRGDFAFLAPLVDRLAVGAAGLVTNAMPGVDRLVETAGPFIEDLATELPNLGNAVSDFFTSLSAGGPGARQAFHDILVLTEKTVVALGNMIEFLSKGYALVSGIAAGMHGDMTGALRIMDQFGDKGPRNLHTFRNAATAMFQTVNPGLEELQSKLSQTAVTADNLAGEMTGKLFNSMMSIDQAVLGFAESQTRLSESIKENGRALDIHTAKGQSNRESILAAVQANMAQYQANIAVGMAAGDAALAYDANTTALENQLRAAHFTQAEIDGLIGKYRGVPGRVNTDIATNGLTDAINGLSDLIREINHIPTSKKVYIDTIHRQLFETPGHFGGGGPPIDGYAYGGRVGHMAVGGRYKVGENGPEEVVLPDDAFVVPNNQLTRGAGPEVLDAVDIPIRGRDSMTGEVVLNALLRLSKQRGRTVAQLLQIAT